MHDTLQQIVENLNFIVGSLEAKGAVTRKLNMREALTESGMSAREIEALVVLIIQKQPARVLAERWLVGTGRVAQIKAKTIRKLRNPLRAPLVKRFKLMKHLIGTNGLEAHLGRLIPIASDKPGMS